MTELDRLLDALTTAAETNHHYPAARRAVTEHVAKIAAERDALRKALEDVRKTLVDDMGPLV
jgi:hypothetical protein